MRTLPPPLEMFLTEMGQDLGFGPELANGFRKAFDAIDREGDDNPDALKFMQAIGMICAQPYSVRERFEAIDMVATQPKGRVSVTIKLSE